MTVTPDVDEFAGKIVQDGHTVEIDEGAKSIVIAIRTPDLQFPSPPDAWSMVVHGGNGVTHLVVRPTGTAPARFTLMGWPNLQKMTLDDSSSSNKGFAGAIELNLLATGEPFGFDSTSWAYTDLTIEHGRVQLDRRVNPVTLTIKSGGVNMPVAVTGELTLSQHVELPGGFSAGRTILAGRVRIANYPGSDIDRPTRLGEVTAAKKEPQLTVAGNVSCASLATGMWVEMDSGSLSVDEATQVTFSGDGHIRVIDGHNLTFGDATNLTLQLVVGDSIDGASGEVTTLSMTGASLTGSAIDPLRMHRIDAADGAQLQDVDLSHLTSLGNIQVLRDAHRVSPIMSTKFPELELMAEAHPTALTTSARQVFWAQLADVVSEKKARGAVQSSARFVAAHARWNDAPARSREKTWLSAYRWVGYGESILDPLVIHVLATTSILFLVLLDVGSMRPGIPISDWVDGLVYWWNLFVSPLSFFFRDPQDPLIKGAWLAQFLTTLIRIEGIAMLFFSLAALRRLTKAE